MRFSLDFKAIIRTSILILIFSALIGVASNISLIVIMGIGVSGFIFHALVSYKIYGVMILEDNIEIERTFQQNIMFKAQNIEKIIIHQKHHPSRLDGFVIDLDIILKQGEDYSFNSFQLYNDEFSKQFELFSLKNNIQFTDEN